MGVTLLVGDVFKGLASLPNDSVHCIVTSPPYFGLRNYEVAGQIGLEPTFQEYLETIDQVCRDLWRVLHPSGTFWLNIGDTHANDRKWGGCSGGLNRPTPRTRQHTGFKPKDLMLVPFRVAIRLQESGWYVRQHITWYKKNPKPESAKDRPTSATESIFLLTKSEHYFYNHKDVKTPTKPDTVARYKRGRKTVYDPPGQDAHRGSVFGPRPNQNMPTSWASSHD